VLETEYTIDSGRVRVTDAMPWSDRDDPSLVHRVEGLAGRVSMRSELIVRFDYGSAAPWIQRDGDRIHAFTGPDAVTLDMGRPPNGQTDHGDPVWLFDVAAGDVVDFRLAYHRSRNPAPERLDVAESLRRTTQAWRDWTDRCTYQGPYRDAVVRSLITLKTLTYRPSGGIVAAPTTSLREQLGGVRNWDYRYCWIRDATFTLLALLEVGYNEEATAWREWLLRALAGKPEQMQIMYGVEGERRLTELEIDWLSGYEGARPVRVGNAATTQFQLDVYGELMDALHHARRLGVPPEQHAWDVQCSLLEFLESHWRDADFSIWEMRGTARDFTHSKVMAWAAFDRAVRAAENFGLAGPVDRWRGVRSAISEEVCTRGYDADRNTFTQHYGSSSVDAALLLMNEVGFLPPGDDRMRGTVAAIEQELCADGFVKRYSTSEATRELDGLPPGEGTFLPCTFWLADAYAAQGRTEDARRLFERLLSLRNDVGLLAEEYDVAAGRMVGNFPQALSHIALINTALNLDNAQGPRRARTGREHRPADTTSPREAARHARLAPPRGGRPGR
jgi:GH15 family glucan-1,4-alpha-glucosidase